MSDVKDAQGQVLNDTYLIGKFIGQGSMGAVYEASHVRLHYCYAVKIITPAALRHPEARVRFEREALITSSLDHPNIVKVFDCYHTLKGVPYIIMELLEGESMLARVRRRGRLSLPETTSMFQQVCGAMAMAHAKGIIHRDLKPSNIFLCSLEGRDDFVKVLDFGISKIIGDPSELTQAKTIMGTPAYIAPEQMVRGARHVDHRSDIYSLGAILFEMLVGEPPFTADCTLELLTHIVNQKVPSLSRFRRDLPAGLETVILCALAKQPDDRFSSVEDLWTAYETALMSLEDPIPNLSTEKTEEVSSSSLNVLNTENKDTVQLKMVQAAARGPLSPPREPGPSSVALELESSLERRDEGALWAASSMKTTVAEHNSLDDSFIPTVKSMPAARTLSGPAKLPLDPQTSGELTHTFSVNPVGSGSQPGAVPAVRLQQGSLRDQMRVSPNGQEWGASPEPAQETPQEPEWGASPEPAQETPQEQKWEALGEPRGSMRRWIVIISVLMLLFLAGLASVLFLRREPVSSSKEKVFLRSPADSAWVTDQGMTPRSAKDARQEISQVIWQRGPDLSSAAPGDAALKRDPRESSGKLPARSEDKVVFPPWPQNKKAVLQVSALAEGKPISVTVLVDDKTMGFTPLYLGRLSPGAHRVQAQKPGYRTASKRVMLSTGKIIRAVFVMRRLDQGHMQSQ